MRTASYEEHESWLFEGTVQEAAIKTLRWIAWFDLFSGIVTAVVIWVKFLPSMTALGIGAAVFLQALLGWALLRVIAYIAADLSEIRRGLGSSRVE